MKLPISPQRLARLLMVISLGLCAVSLAMGLIGDLTGHRRLMGVGRMFNVAAEANIPTWYASSLLLICAVLLGAIALKKTEAGDRFARHWSALCLAVLFLSADESSSFHETVGAAMDRFAAPPGLMQLSWVLPAAVLAVLFGLAFIRFAASLPGAARRGLLSGAFVFASGALGLEAAGGIWRSAHGETPVLYTLAVNTEEFLEMAGVVILIRTLAAYAAGMEQAGDLPGPASRGAGIVPAGRT